MGYGDSLMARGDAWKLHQKTGAKIAIGDGLTISSNDSDLNYGMDFLATQDEVDQGDIEHWVHSYSGNRPYINYEAIERALKDMGIVVAKRSKMVRRLNRYIFRHDYQATPAPVVLTHREVDIAEELAERGPVVVVEPHIKRQAPLSKQWPQDRYAQVIRELRKDYLVYQIGAPEFRSIAGLQRLPTTSFRNAMAHLAGAALYIGPEGGLHHASAAVGTRAVVLFGGYISPRVTGYDIHTNLTGDNAGYDCGTRHGRCAHCVTAMESITVESVVQSARKHLKEYVDGMV